MNLENHLQKKADFEQGKTVYIDSNSYFCLNLK